jgi:site-specific DNA recombinase
MERSKPRIRRCAIYTRKSSEEGLGQEFKSLHAQREACEAFIRSQAGEGWRLVRTHYHDGGLSGATMERPALRRLLADVDQGLVDAIVVYKVDRLTRSLADFAKMVEVFDARGVSFVAVTQQFNTTTSMGRLTLNVQLSSHATGGVAAVGGRHRRTHGLPNRSCGGCADRRRWGGSRKPDRHRTPGL